MTDHVEQIIEGYIDLFGDDSSTDVTAPDLTAADHTHTAISETADLESESADGYRTTAERTIALADILSGLDATTVQLIMDNARDNETVREQLKVWLSEYRSNKAALMSFLDTPTGQAALASLSANTITTATEATQQGSNRNTDRAGLAATVGDQYSAQSPSAGFVQQTGHAPAIGAGSQSGSSGGGAPRGGFTTAPNLGRAPASSSLFSPSAGTGSGGGGGGRPSFAAPSTPMQLAAPSGPSFTPAAAITPIGAGGGGGGGHPGDNSLDYSWVRADPGSRSEVSTTQGEAAVRAALDKLGMPYAWGGGGPDGPSQGISDGGGAADANGDFNKIGFDCSGLMQYAIAQATDGAVILPRTTYDQINAGIAVSADQLQPGDLIFPNEGHVQMYIGDGKVIEAQQSGTNIMISPLGDFIAARRVL